MAQNQKQKVLLAALAVAVLGMGSYFLFLRDSGGGAQTAMNTGPAVRRVKKENVDNAPKRRESTRRESKAEQAAPERREREEVEAPTATRRERKDSRKEVQRRKLSPAA